MRSCLRFLALCLGIACAGQSLADDADDDEYTPKNWQELSVQWPAMPTDAGLLPFTASAATTNRFFVDGPSLSVGSDGVVRYVLVILTEGGARNVSFEGMRCESRERRIYATGRADGSWAKSRVERWQRIQDVPSNRHYAALFGEYFCPGGVIVGHADEARDALRRGGHPSTKHW